MYFISLAEKRQRQKPSNESRFILSPSKSNYSESDHQNSAQFQVSTRYHSGADAHLPPDLLPYGQHQAITIHNSLASSSSTKGTFTTSSPMLSSKHIAFASSFDDDINHGLIINNDYRLHENRGTDNADGAFPLADNYLSRRTSDEIDLRIYDTDKEPHHRKFYASTSKAASEPNAAASMTTNTRTVIATGKSLMSPIRNIDSYARSASLAAECAAFARTTASPYYSANPSLSTAKVSVAVPHSSVQQPSLVKLSDNGGTNVSNCKPRQSIVRTSTSFSFLSTGYNQQQDNFL